MTIEIEDRPYGPMSGPEEVAALKSRVYLFKDDIIMWDEIPITTVFSVKKFVEKLNEITKDISNFYILVDLTKNSRPSAKVRAVLKAEYEKLANFKHAAVFTGSNFMLNIASKFILSFVGLHSFSVHKTMEEALAEIEKHKKKDSMAV